MHIIALVESADHVCCRYRIQAFESSWRAAGHKLTLLPLARGLFSRAAQFRQLASADLVILQRRLLSAMEMYLLRRSARRLVYDCDDAMWLRDSYANKGLTSRRRQRRFNNTLRTVDHISVGNCFLADRCAQVVAKDKITVIPTVVDVTSYPLADHYLRAEDPLQLVWLGSSSTLQGMEQNQSFLDRIAEAIPGVRLKVICDRFPEPGKMPIDAVTWKSSTERVELARSDIGIAWNPDDDWSRGKCGLKVIQYQAAGLPVLANPVGIHVDLVRSGENGYLISTPEEAIAAVRALQDPATRARQGYQGRMLVERKYHVTVASNQWIEMFSRLDVNRFTQQAA